MRRQRGVSGAKGGTHDSAASASGDVLIRVGRRGLIIRQQPINNYKLDKESTDATGFSRVCARLPHRGAPCDPREPA